MAEQNSDNVSEELMLRDRLTGRWIKRSDKETTLSSNLIPSSLITIHNNIIHYTDTNKIIEKIAEESKSMRISFIEDKYNKIIDSLDNYRAYGAGIDKVFDGCAEYSSSFDNRIRAIAGEFDYNFKYNNENSMLLEVSSAYLKILFSYLFSSFILHKSKVKNETVIYTKLLSFKGYLQSLLEKILIPDNYHGALQYNESIYSNFIFGTMDISVISDLIKYDSRFDNELALIKSHTGILRNRNCSSYQNEFNLSGKYNEIKDNCKQWQFVISLYNLLCDIDNLISIRNEIHNIEDEGIFIEYENNLKNG